MTYDPDAAARWAEATRAAAADAESALIERTAAELAGGIDDNPYWAAAKREQLGGFRRALDENLRPVLATLGDTAAAAVAGAAGEAAAAAAAEVTAALAGAAAEFAESLPGTDAFLALTREAVDQPAAAARNAIEGMNNGILRDIDDAYRRVIADVESRVLLGAQTQREVAQEALDRWATMGITGFTDRAGRRWDLASYAEMATRTAAQRAALDAHNAQLQAMGVDLAFVSDAPQECKRCRPWEGKILALRGGAGPRTVEHEITGKPVEIMVAGTIADARSGGLWHPNALLGDGPVELLGEAQNACRADYDGPSVTVTTARGYRLTVSPNHPVLTTAGWARADQIRVGNQVISQVRADAVPDRPLPHPDLDHVPATRHEVFDALGATGARARGPVSADDFHGDGRHYGQVDVVWAARYLRRVGQADSVELGGHQRFVGSGAGGTRLTCSCPQGTALDRVGAPVGGSLADLDTSGLESATDGRLADAEGGAELLACLAGLVSADQVVEVDLAWFRGHAYDFQTGSGAYITNGIVAHNCRHTMDAYFPGVTRVPTDTEDPEGDRARQRLRELERRVRRAKREQAAAITPQAAAQARAKVRARQADIRAHVDAHPGLLRQPHREQLMTGRPQPGTRPELPPLPRGGGPGPARPGAPGRTPTAAERIEAGDLSGLRRVGGQAGSNEGGLYEAEDGTRWYVKAPRSADHAANEALAADLYRAAGIDVPEVRLGRGAPGLPDRQLIASRIVPDATSDLREQLGRNRKYGRQAREGFAVDAWLGNWDVAGLGFDNIVTSGGKPVRIDVGGSLLFRAQGQPKGPAFGPKVNEWSTLRDPSNPQASTLFAGLTDREIIASAERVERVKPERIRELVAARGLPPDLAETLIERRADIARRANSTRRGMEFDTRAQKAAKGPAALFSTRQRMPTRGEGQGEQFLSDRPIRWTDQEYADRSRAVNFYRDDDYEGINAYYRTGDKTRRREAEDLHAAFNGSELERDVVVHRGIGSPTRMFGDKWYGNDLADVEWTEPAFSSTSTDPRVADYFALEGEDPTVMTIVVPKGTRAIRLSDQAPADRHPTAISDEAEILLDIQVKYRIVRDNGVVDGVRRLDVEVITT